jgi:hypothetical protein
MAHRLLRVRYGIAALLIIAAGRPAVAQVPPPEMAPMAPPDMASSAATPPPTYPDPALPGHLGIGNQQFDASVGGLRSYLESIRSKDPGLYSKLDPQLQHLEGERTTATIVLAAAVGVGLASGIYAIAARKDCPAPSISDPNFAASTAAWGACNDDNMHTTTAFGLIGLGAMAAGVIGWAAIAPGRSELLSFVNEHNRLTAEPLRLQLGYDPTSRFAYGGASLSF